MSIIPEWGRPSHRPPASRRILYAGRDHDLPDRLDGALPDCHTIRSPHGWLALYFLESGLPYALLLCDARLPDMTGEEVVRAARSLAHRRRTPCLIIPAGELDFSGLVVSVVRLLAAP